MYLVAVFDSDQDAFLLRARSCIFFLADVSQFTGFHVHYQQGDGSSCDYIKSFGEGYSFISFEEVLIILPNPVKIRHPLFGLLEAHSDLVSEGDFS